MSRSIQSARRALLRFVNRGRLHSVTARMKGSERVPTFVIASPPDMHLAPLAVMNGHPRIAHVIVGNGLGDCDVEWIQAQTAGIPIVQLKASLKGNARTYLSHAEVIRLCQRASGGDFAIQDADCFVTEPAWWSELRVCSKSEYAAGPFYKPLQKLGVWMPDTYLVLINGASYRRREALGVEPEIRRDMNGVSSLLRARGITGAYFPEEGKNYADTLQLHWLAAALGGEEFRSIPGADECVFHVGGSSYLTGKHCEDVSHWDYWPLNTCYFHLRILEHPQFACIRPRFTQLFQNYGSAEALLEKYPEFENSRRFAGSQRILNCYSESLRS